VRFFNFWEPVWPERMRHQLNPDVTVRSRGIMEKCTFCIQRIRRTSRVAARDGEELSDDSRELNPACVNACPTDTLFFGDLNDPDSKVSKMKKEEMGDDGRGYELMPQYGTSPNVIYLKKVDESAKDSNGSHA
jgi:molybdopterin-containing oxidoreductase family iron-sulfur binding subunit